MTSTDLYIASAGPGPPRVTRHRRRQQAMTTAATDFAMPVLGALLPPAAREAGLRLTNCLSTRSGPAFRARPERRVFPGRPDQVACARRFISRILSRCPAAADAVLLTSELVTNTLLHTSTGAGGDFEVTARHG